MKGLLIKDFLNLKGFARSAIAIVAIYAVISIVSANVSFLTSLVMVYCAVLPMTSVSLDEVSKWNAYVQCMPVTRKQSVQSKYIMVLLIGLMATGLSLIMALLTSFRAPLDWAGTLLSNGLIFCLVVGVNALTLPAMYHFGVEKARIFIMVFFMLCMLPFILIMNNGGSIPSLDNFPLFVIPLAVVLLFGASYFVSVKIYTAKEF